MTEKYQEPQRIAYCLRTATRKTPTVETGAGRCLLVAGSSSTVHGHHGGADHPQHGATMDLDKAAAPTRVGAAARAVRTGALGVMFILQKRIVAHNWRTVLGTLIRGIQMLAFIFTTNAAAGFHWRHTSDWLAFALSLTNIQNYLFVDSVQFSDASYLLLYYLSLTICLLFVLLYLFAAWSFMRNSILALWPLKLLRAIGQFSATTLYIPILSMLITVFNCEQYGYWTNTGFECYRGGHLAQVIISAVVAVVFIGVSDVGRTDATIDGVLLSMRESNDRGCVTTGGRKAGKRKVVVAFARASIP